jgi:UDP-N-acetylenolpyruvoylglucosamine reductase
MRYNEPLANYTSWRVGGVADKFYQPADKADLICLCKTYPNMNHFFGWG